jgi:hypothetical protein
MMPTIPMIIKIEFIKDAQLRLSSIVGNSRLRKLSL